MMLICTIDMVLQVASSATKLHLPAKQLVLILGVLLLPLINGIEPLVEAGELIIQVLIEVGCIEIRRAHCNAAPSH